MKATLFAIAFAIVCQLIGYASARTIDVNGDGQYTVEDVDYVCWGVNVAKLEPDEPSLVRRFDFNEDGYVFKDDFGTYLEITGTPQGDFTFDGIFNEQDIVKAFIESGRRWSDGMDGVRWQGGDASCNDIFNSRDFVAMFEAGTWQGGQAATAVVPEPSSAWLLGLGLIHLATTRFRRRNR